MPVLQEVNPAKYPLTQILGYDIILVTNDIYSRIKASLEAHNLLS
jgi:vacuolar-type H+-ATPase subunit F/Vma7